MHLGKGHQVHGDLVQIDVEVSFEPHRAGQVVDNVRNDRVFLLKLVLLLLTICSFDDAGALFNRHLTLLFSFHLLVLLVHSGDQVEEGLIING